MQAIQLQWIDYAILIAYVAFVIGIGWMLARYMKTSSDFLTSARSIPTWVTGLAFISANLGALELVGMAAKRREIWHIHRAFLLGRRDSGDDFSRRIHDAVLLRFQGTLRS